MYCPLLLLNSYDKITPLSERGDFLDKVLIAMSGGVDSSVAAYLMLSKGYSCAGGTMKLCDNVLLGLSQESTSEAITDAKCVANKLGIDFYVFDHVIQFRERVVDKFVQSYELGETPNPCVNCNRFLKFDVLLNDALTLGYQYIATGHYAKIKKDSVSERYLLCKAADQTKDQSYFLANLSQHQLAHTKFPLGDLTKSQIREIAENQGFINARKRDSQDVCFIPDGDYVAFMERYTGKTYPAGNYLNLAGEVVGQHRGAVCYTIGQRKGLALAMGEPVYKLEMTENFIYISTLGEENVENSDSTKKLPAEDNLTETPSEDFQQDEVIDTDTYDDTPERTSIEITSEVSVDEYDEFFLLYIGKSAFYIIPKKDFSEYELEAVREINNESLSIK